MDFHRLKINDVSDSGNQPMKLGNYYLICNGEIFNHKDIETMLNVKTTSESDCEIILHLYSRLKHVTKKKYVETISQICDMLDGEFAFCLYDADDQMVFVARDPFGVRPLFYSSKTMSVASELKAFKKEAHPFVSQFPPGHYSVARLGTNDKHAPVMIPYFTSLSVNPNSVWLKYVKYHFENAVKKRVMSDRGVCALLSGGLDSSLVAALVSKYLPYQLETYSIGFEGSPDLKYAEMVANHIGSKHTSIVVDKSEFLNAIETVIKAIESYDTTTVRASVGNYLVSKYIKEHSKCVVVFNGDYADEVCGGYKYLQNAPDGESFHQECTRLVRDICFFDSLRSDRCISAHGLEARVPFADKYFVNYYLNIAPHLRESKDNIEKNILRKAFAEDNLFPNENLLLPNEILWRKKEAFSDGVSQASDSWGDIVRKYVDEQVSDEEFNTYNYMKFKLKETYYYHKLFSKYYKNDNIIPYLWMPKFCDGSIIDPSARKL
jgi:asparagine synthase (glutamine-hydrolysing)